MWVNNAWYAAGWSHDLGAGRIEYRLIDLDPVRRMLPTSHDTGPTQFRRLVETLLARDGQSGPAATARVG